MKYLSDTGVRTLWAKIKEKFLLKTDTSVVKTSGDQTIGGTKTFSNNVSFNSQGNGVSLTTLTSTDTPAIKSYGTHITGGADVAGLSKLNNFAIQTWNGFSVSPTITGQPVPHGTPAFSVNARNGEVFAYSSIYMNNGLKVATETYVASYVASHVTNLQYSILSSATTGSLAMTEAGSALKVYKGTKSIDIGFNRANVTVSTGSVSYSPTTGIASVSVTSGFASRLVSFTLYYKKY